MKSTILTLIFTMLCKGAVVSVCTTGCTTTSLQTALDSLAACGDTIQIKSTEPQTGNFLLHYRGCASGTPITVTSDRAGAYLANTNARVTPSQLGNMAQIIANSSSPALQGVLDGMNRPPAHWKFVGVAFSTTVGTFFLVGFNANGEATTSSQIADDITFDRDYFFMASSGNYGSGGVAIQDVIRGDATNLTVKNSFIGDSFFNGNVESHGVRALTSAGPVTVTNTFITTSSIPIFVGGSTPSYPTYLENGLTAQYNYFWHPWKYNNEPAQPYAADYVSWAQNTFRTGPWIITGITNGGIITTPGAPPFFTGSLLNITGVGGCTVANANNWRMTQLNSTTYQLLNFPGCNSAYTSGGSVSDFATSVCSKNLGELKWGTGVTWQYNVGENAWQPQGFCQSQWTGFTDTLRTQWDWNITSSSIGTFAMSDTTHITWTGTYRIGGTGTTPGNNNINDNAVCLSLPTTGTECHAFTSFSGASLVSSTAFSAAPVGALNGWFVYTGSAKYENVAVSHNVWKNVDSPYAILALSYANGVGDAGFGKNHTVSQNLAYANISYITGYKGFNMSASEADDNWSSTGYTLDHNTFYYPNGLAHGSFVYLNGTSCSSCATAIQPKFNSSAITNNLFGVSAAGGNGPFSGDSTGNDVILTANMYFTNTNIKNNAIPGGGQSGSASGGNAVSGNFYAAWSDPFGGLASKGIFKLTPGGAYSGHGTDLRDVGNDFDRLPQISSAKVTAGVTAALLEFDLTVPILDAGATQPCILEVSSNRNLQSDLGSYTVVNDLNPVFFKQGDTSSRSNAALPAVVMSGRHVYWPIGQNATVTGDDGAGHSLALAAGTTYYGRLMCYGDSQWFTFQTGSGLSNSVQYPLTATLQVGTTAGTTGVRLQYGATPALGGTTNFALNGSGTASVTLPLANGSPTYYKLQFLNGATVTYTGPTTVYLGGA